MSRSTFLTPFKVGLLVIAAFAATAVMVTVLSGGKVGGKSDHYVVYAIFDDVTGLVVNSRVQMAGIPIGQIHSIELAGSRARVDVRLEPHIKLFEGIKRTANGKTKYVNGATIAKKQASFIGDYFLEITPGTAGKQLVDGDQIQNIVESVSIDDMLERLNDITADIQAVTHSLAAVFGGPEGQEKVRKLVDDVAKMVDTLGRFVTQNSDKVDNILSNAEAISRDARVLTRDGIASVQTILRDAEAIVQEVRYVVGQSSGDLQSGLGTLKGTLASLQSSLDSLNYSLQNIQDITDKINEGEGTIGELVNNPVIADRTEQILTDAGDYLQRLSKLRTILELRSEYHLQAKQLKNVLGLRLQPSREKYYRLELIDDFRGTTTIVQERINTTDTGRPDGAFQETRVTTTEDFKASVEYARVFDVNPWISVTGRFGLIESSGGVGLDLDLLPQHELQVRTDLFDFGFDVNPRYRAIGSYEFFKIAYLAGGVDDIFNPGRRDYFIGAGIRFDDEDLKALLTTTGLPTQ